MSRSRVPQTLSREMVISGRGLHGNQPCEVRLVPVDQPVGLTFVHMTSGVEIPVRAAFVGDIRLATTLVKDGVRLQTIEHLLSALMGLEVEHLRIEVRGEGLDTELPILDGSAAPWVEAILRAGVQGLDGTRRFIKVTKSVEVRQGEKWIRVSPFDGFRIRYTIDFPIPALGRQSRELSLTPEKYRREVGQARTFCLEQEIEFMRSKGLALGGSLDNAVVYGANGPLNDGLRYEDEAVRHKMLDLVGDLALLGAPLMGLVEVHAGGHAMHVALCQALLSDVRAWAWVEAEDVAPRAKAFFQPLQPAYA